MQAHAPGAHACVCSVGDVPCEEQGSVAADNECAVVSNAAWEHMHNCSCPDPSPRAARPPAPTPSAGGQRLQVSPGISRRQPWGSETVVLQVHRPLGVVRPQRGLGVKAHNGRHRRHHSIGQDQPCQCGARLVSACGVAESASQVACQRFAVAPHTGRACFPVVTLPSMYGRVAVANVVGRRCKAVHSVSVLYAWPLLRHST